MASYNATSQEFNKMQQEALARVREMQKRSQTYVEPEPPPQSPPPTAHKPETSGLSGLSGLFSSQGQTAKDLVGKLLKDIHIDEEKAIIALLIYVLYKNGGDVKLMLALGYLLL